jgi:hypothetical protein
MKFEEGNPGKPKGALNKTTRMVKQVFADVFEKLQEDPEANLITWARQNQTEFYKLSTKLIPIQMAGDPDNPIPFNAAIDYTLLPTSVLEAIIAARIKPNESDETTDD